MEQSIVKAKFYLKDGRTLVAKIGNVICCSNDINVDGESVHYNQIKLVEYLDKYNIVHKKGIPVQPARR